MKEKLDTSFNLGTFFLYGASGLMRSERSLARLSKDAVLHRETPIGYSTHTTQRRFDATIVTAALYEII